MHECFITAVWLPIMFLSKTTIRSELVIATCILCEFKAGQEFYLGLVLS